MGLSPLKKKRYIQNVGSVIEMSAESFSKNFAKDHFDEIKKAMGCLVSYKFIDDIP